MTRKASNKVAFYNNTTQHTITVLTAPLMNALKLHVIRLERLKTLPGLMSVFLTESKEKLNSIPPFL